MIWFQSSSTRRYSLWEGTNLGTAGYWSSVPGRTNVPGYGGLMSLDDTNTAPANNYRLEVKLP
jgi:hypothetical protein